MGARPDMPFVNWLDQLAEIIADLHTQVFRGSQVNPHPGAAAERIWEILLDLGLWESRCFLVDPGQELSHGDHGVYDPVLDVILVAVDCASRVGVGIIQDMEIIPAKYFSRLFLIIH